MLLVVVGLVAPEHGRPAQQRQLAGADVVVVDRRRHRHGRVAEPDRGLGEVRVPARADRVDLVVELDEVVVAHRRVVGAVAELDDAELGQPLAALVHDEMAGERVDVLEPDGWVVGDQRRPVLGSGGRDGRGADLEVRTGVVVQHEEDVLAADGRVVEGVLQTLPARAEQLEAGIAVAGVEEAELRGDLGPGRDDHEPVAAAAANAHEEPAVLLVVDELVVGLGGAEGVPPDLVGAPGLVDGRVVELLARRVPGGAPDDADDLVGAVLAGGQVEDPDRVALVADNVGRVGEEGAVGADAGAAQREELVAVGQCVEVEQQLLAREGGLVGRGVLGGPRRCPVVGAGHRDPTAGAVLLPLEGPAVVPVAAVAGRHREVGLAGAGLDLVEDRLPQVGEVRGLCLRVLVLRLEVGHHLRRALGAQPFVVVDAGPSVVLGGDGAAWGDRRLRRRFGGVLHTSEPIAGSLDDGRRRGRSSSTGSGFRMWRSRGICGATPNSCGAICGTRRMSNFLWRTPCAPLRAGHRTLPPINQRPWPKRRSGIRQKRRSAPRGNSRRRPGDGVGGVGEAAGSRGASPSLLARGPLGAHTIERPSPLLPLWNRPCRVQGGDRVPTGLPEGARVPSRRRFPWGSRETPRRSRFAGDGSGPRSQPVRRRRHGTRVIEGFGRR